MKKTLLGIVAGGLLAAQVAFGYEPRPSVHLGERYVQAGELTFYVLENSFSIPALKDEWTEEVLPKKLGELSVKTDECYRGIDIDKWGFVCSVSDDVCIKYEDNKYVDSFLLNAGKNVAQSTRTSRDCSQWEKRAKAVFAVPWKEMSGVQNCGTFGEDNLCFYDKKGVKYEVDLPSEGEAVRAAQTIVDLQYILSEIERDTKKWPVQVRAEEAGAVYHRALEQLSLDDRAINTVVDAIHSEALNPESWATQRNDSGQIEHLSYTLLKAKLPHPSRVLTILERRTNAIDDPELRQRLQRWVKELREVTP